MMCLEGIERSDPIFTRACLQTEKDSYIVLIKITFLSKLPSIHFWINKSDPVTVPSQHSHGDGGILPERASVKKIKRISEYQIVSLTGPRPSQGHRPRQRPAGVWTRPENLPGNKVSINLTLRQGSCHRIDIISVRFNSAGLLVCPPVIHIQATVIGASENFPE